MFNSVAGSKNKFIIIKKLAIYIILIFIIIMVRHVILKVQ